MSKESRGNPDLEEDPDRKFENIFLLFIKVTRDYEYERRWTEPTTTTMIFFPIEIHFWDNATIFLPIGWLVLWRRSYAKIPRVGDDDVITRRFFFSWTRRRKVSTSKLHNWPPIFLSKAAETVRQNEPKLLLRPKENRKKGKSVSFSKKWQKGIPVLWIHAIFYETYPLNPAEDFAKMQ